LVKLDFAHLSRSILMIAWIRERGPEVSYSLYYMLHRAARASGIEFEFEFWGCRKSQVASHAFAHFARRPSVLWQQREALRRRDDDDAEGGANLGLDTVVRKAATLTTTSIRRRTSWYAVSGDYDMSATVYTRPEGPSSTKPPSCAHTLCM
jgi:hypothetical protein